MRSYHRATIFTIVTSLLLISCSEAAIATAPSFLRTLNEKSNCDCSAVNCFAATAASTAAVRQSSDACASECCTCYCDAYVNGDCQEYCSSTLSYTCGDACCTCDSNGARVTTTTTTTNSTSSSSSSANANYANKGSGSDWGTEKPWYSFASFHLPVKGGPEMPKGRPQPKGKPKGKAAPKRPGGGGGGSSNGQWGGSTSSTTTTTWSTSSNSNWSSSSSSSSKDTNTTYVVVDSSAGGNTNEDDETCKCTFWEGDGCQLWFEGSIRLTEAGAACAERCCGPRDAVAAAGATSTTATTTTTSVSSEAPAADSRTDIYTGSGNRIDANTGNIAASTKGDAKRSFALLAVAVGAACMGLLLLAMLAMRHRKRKASALLDLEDGRSHPLHGAVKKRMTLFSKFAKFRGKGDPRNATSTAPSTQPPASSDDGTGNVTHADLEGEQ